MKQGCTPLIAEREEDLVDLEEPMGYLQAGSEYHNCLGHFRAVSITELTSFFIPWSKKRRNSFRRRKWEDQVLPEDLCTWRQTCPVCCWTRSPGGPYSASLPVTQVLKHLQMQVPLLQIQVLPAVLVFLPIVYAIECEKLTRLECEVLPRTKFLLPLLLWQDLWFLKFDIPYYCGIVWLNPNWMTFQAEDSVCQELGINSKLRFGPNFAWSDIETLNIQPIWQESNIIYANRFFSAVVIYNSFLPQLVVKETSCACTCCIHRKQWCNLTSYITGWDSPAMKTKELGHSS